VREKREYILSLECVWELGGGSIAPLVGFVRGWLDESVEKEGSTNIYA